jgi:hypothetical protein
LDYGIFWGEEIVSTCTDIILVFLKRDIEKNMKIMIKRILSKKGDKI